MKRRKSESSAALFVFYSLGVFVSYILYGLLQERITRNWHSRGIDLGWFLTFAQCGFYAVSTSRFVVFSSKRRKSKRKHVENPRRSPPIKTFATIGALSLMTIGLSNTALFYLSYPTQVIFKCQKPATVMLVGVAFYSKRHSFKEYLAIALLTVGLIVFSLTNKNLDSDTFSMFGVACMSIALIVDGVIGNVQRQLFVNFSKVSASEMICKTKGTASLLALGACALNGQLKLAIQTIDREQLKLILIYSALGALGEQFVMRIIKHPHYGALPAVVVTSLRKFLTITLSFFFFPKPFSLAYLVGASLVFSGVYLNVSESKKKNTSDKKPSHAHNV